MLNYLFLEKKIIGNNIHYISILVAVMFLVIFNMGGNLVDWHYLGFEVIFPFYTTIGVTQWCKVSTDEIFDLVKAQSKSIFKWILIRYTFVFCVMSVYSCLLIIIIHATIPSFSVIELFFVYLTTSFYLSSVGMLCSVVFRNHHTSTAVCGTLWLSSLLTKNIAQNKIVTYFYLFLRFVDVQNHLWITNKLLLGILGIGIWIIIYLLCVKRHVG